MKKAIIALAALLCAAPAGAQTTLNFSSWVPPTHPIQAGMIAPWADEVAKATDGRVKVNILPKPLGGPAAHFDLARDGTADAVFAVHGYTPGRFVLTKVVEFPFLGNDAEAISVAYWRVHEKYLAAAGEHKGVKVLSVFSHGPGEIFNAKRPIEHIGDLQGLKIRVGGGVVNEVAKVLDMAALLKPAPESYELLSNGVADGVLFPSESLRSFRLVNLVRYATLVPGGLYNTSFVLAMNQAKFDALPKPDQEALTKVSGEHFAHLAGKAWNKADAEALSAFQDAGGQVTKASPELVAEIKKRTAPLEAEWIAAAKAKKVDGAAALAELRADIKALESK